MKRTDFAGSASTSPWVKLLLGSFALLSTAANAADVSITDGLVSLTAERVPMQEVLDTLAERSDLRLIQHAPIDREVSIRINSLPLAEALDMLLDTRDSYQLFMPPPESADGGGRVPGTLWVFAAGTGKPYAIDFLETVLLRGEIGEKKEAIRTLRNDATPAAVQALSFALSDRDRRARDAAIEALGAIGSDEALAALASAGGVDNPVERAAVTYAMAASGAASARAYLDAALEDDDPRVRLAAAEALGDLGDDASRRRIQAAMNDPDPAVRERAVEILEDLDDEAMFRALFPRNRALPMPADTSVTRGQ